MLVDTNVAARAVRALSRSRDAVLDELRVLAQQIEPRPISAVVFGSFARGDAGATTDLDVLIIRPASVSADDDTWTASIEEWRTAVRRLTGNPVQVFEIDETEGARHLRRPSPLWTDVIRDGVVVSGSPPDALRGRRVDRSRLVDGQGHQG